MARFVGTERIHLSVEYWVLFSAFPSSCGLPVLPVDYSEAQIRTQAELVISAEYPPHQSALHATIGSSSVLS